MAIMSALVRIGRDAELRTLNDGTAVLNLALAYNYGKKENGKQPSQWVDASLFGARAEKLAQYLVKGQQLVVTLSDVYVREYQKKDGTTGNSLCGRVMDLEFAGSPPAQKQAAQPAPQRAQPQGVRTGGAAQSAGPTVGFEDDDIPFAPRHWKEGL